MAPPSSSFFVRKWNESHSILPDLHYYRTTRGGSTWLYMYYQRVVASTQYMYSSVGICGTPSLSPLYEIYEWGPPPSSPLPHTLALCSGFFLPKSGLAGCGSVGGGLRECATWYNAEFRPPFPSSSLSVRSSYRVLCRFEVPSAL